MEALVSVTQQDVSVAHNAKNHKEIQDGPAKLMGIEIDLFSYKVPEGHFEQVLKEICGGAFNFKMVTGATKGSNSYFIFPQEYCLVEGGMMYTSAVNILKQLTTSGLLVSEFRTVCSN
jgi:hypothetical protein